METGYRIIKRHLVTRIIVRMNRTRVEVEGPRRKEYTDHGDSLYSGLKGGPSRYEE